MRHRKHKHQLGVKKEHRAALMGNLATALFTHGRIRTTLAKAKALRPFSEKVITLAKKAAATDDAAKKVHFRRLAIARVRDKAAIKMLFDERVTEFVDRNGGYTRIYKLIPRIGDAADMAIIELVEAADEGYSKSKRKAGKKAVKSAEKDTEVAAATEDSAEVAAVADDSVTQEASETEQEAEAKVAEEPVAEETSATEADSEEEEPKA